MVIIAPTECPLCDSNPTYFFLLKNYFIDKKAKAYRS